MTVKERVKTILKNISEGIYEKDEVMALALLSSIAGESIFLLGPPGVAKSLIARRLKYAYKDGNDKAFEYLMSRFSTPDEIFGPVAISKLKEDKYERITVGYLPSATVVFLDEIWKAGPSIQNALLTVLNEKVFRNGAMEIKIPMKALISASNELPAKDQGLDALWDRFLVRYKVEWITDAKNFRDMISMTSKSESANFDAQITDEEYRAWSDEIDKIGIPENVYKVIEVIRNYVQQHNDKIEEGEGDSSSEKIYISDRRWYKIVRLLRTSAFLNGRKEIDLMDCFLIKHCIWNEERQIPTVSGFIRDAIEKHGYDFPLDVTAIEDGLKTIDNEVTRYAYKATPRKGMRYKTVTKENKTYCCFLYENKSYLIEISVISEMRKKLNQEKRTIVIEELSQRNVEIGFSLKSDVEMIIHSIDNTDCIINFYYPPTIINTEQYEEVERQLEIAPQMTKDWTKRITISRVNVGNLRTQIENYKQNNLKDLRKNVFVHVENAKSVEVKLDDLLSQLEKLDIEAERIKARYG